MSTPQIAPLSTPPPFFGERGLGFSGLPGKPQPFPEQPISPNDDDFYRALSAEEFKERLKISMAKVDEKYARKCV
jgi:hypothetical protein